MINLAHQSCIGNVSNCSKKRDQGRKEAVNYFLERNAALQPLVVSCFLLCFYLCMANLELTC